MITRGQKINDRYQIIRTIGEGGMANVYLAHDLILDRDVAVKVLRGDLANDEKFVRRFQREAISASSLTHPNIVGMYDVGEDDGKYFIVMEYVEGKTLKSLIKRRGALTLSEVIDIMLQLTSGIACAHESYIIHRDIKPQNVLILDDGTVKITDFGIAMALNSNELTQTNSVMGSVHYLPPEQANGNGSTIKSDIYSLGILMYELLTGKLPFKGENAVEIAIKQMKNPIPSVCDMFPEIPQSIENVILKACAKNPKNRYENVMEMHDDIKTALDKNRADEKKYVYPYPEQEVEEKVNISRFKKNEAKRTDEKKDKGDKKTNKVLWITGIICILAAIIIFFVVMVLPKMKAVPDVQIPDVSKMSIVNAEATLKKEGFEVATDVQEEYSIDVDAGVVIGTNPSVGRSVKKGTVVTLIVSKGFEGIVVENYVGQNIQSVEAKLKEQGIVVLIEEKEFKDTEDQKEDIILEQDIAEGEKLKRGDTIVFQVSKLITVYPDFVKEDWTYAGVEEFCATHNVNLVKVEKEDSSVAEGTIIAQSREAGSKVVGGGSVTLRITVAKKPTVIPEEPKEDEKPTEGDKEEPVNKPENPTDKDNTSTDEPTNSSDNKTNAGA